MISRKVFLILAAVIASLIIIAIIGGYSYYAVYRKNTCNLDNSYKVRGNSSINGDNSLENYGNIFKKGEYFKNDKGNYRACPLNRCRNKICIKKCCPPNQVYSKRFGCVDNKTALKIDNLVPLILDYDNKSIGKYELHYGFPSCLGGVQFKSFDNFTHLRLKKDHLVWNKKKYNLLQYCFDYVLTKKENYIKYYAYICDTERSLKLLLGYFNYIPMIIYVVLILMYAYFQDGRSVRNRLYGWCLMSHLACSTVHSMASIITLRPTHSPVRCQIVGYADYLGLMSGFLWENIICFDIWCAFSSKKPISKLNANQMKRFIFYSVYAYGVPFVFACVMFSADRGLFNNPKFIPDMGNINKLCFLNEYYGLWIYYYGPSTILVLCNTILFLRTAFIIRNTLIVASSVSNANKMARKNIKRQMIIYIKLLKLTGITWIAEVIAFIGISHNNSILWQIPSKIISCLRSVYLFYIFVMKGNDKLKKLRRKFFPVLIKPGDSLIELVEKISDSEQRLDGVALNELNRDGSNAITAES